jgi:hypothetical protein
MERVMGNSLIDRVRVGIHLTRIALDSYGTDRFWDAIGWWHGEVHYTIPRIEGEKRVAAELERAFTDDGESNLPFGLQALGVTVKSSISFQDSNLLVNNGKFVIDPPGLNTGQWQYQGFALRTAIKPNLVRRLLIGALTGAEWVADNGDNKKTQVSLGPEYDRLAEFIVSCHPARR